MLDHNLLPLTVNIIKQNNHIQNNNSGVYGKFDAKCLLYNIKRRIFLRLIICILIFIPNFCKIIYYKLSV